MKKMLRRSRAILVIGLVVLFVSLGTFVFSLLIRGYRPNFQNGTLFSTGILSAVSVPRGSLVYLNDKLTTATDDTLNLPPGEYDVKLVKDGYFPWEKKTLIRKEVVFSTDAQLFRSTPDLRALTSTGATNPALSPDGAKIVYAVASASAETKNGVWISDTNETNLNPLKNSVRQLAANTNAIDWSKSTFVWSPDSTQILAVFGPLDNPSSAYLLPTDRLTGPEQFRNIILRLPIIMAEWQQAWEKAQNQQLVKLPPEWQKIATESATLLRFSPDEKKFFYLATAKVDLPANLLPHPPARSTQPEQRNLQPGNIYTYDLSQDTNFLIGEGQKMGINIPAKKESSSLTTTIGLEEYRRQIILPIYWLSTSNHLVFVEDKMVKVIEADATNKQTVFSGPFIDGYAFPTADGTGLLVLTSLNSDLPPNLYTVKIR